MSDNPEQEKPQPERPKNRMGEILAQSEEHLETIKAVLRRARANNKAVEESNTAASALLDSLTSQDNEFKKTAQAVLDEVQEKDKTIAGLVADMESKQKTATESLASINTHVAQATELIKQITVKKDEAGKELVAATESQKKIVELQTAATTKLAEISSLWESAKAKVDEIEIFWAKFKELKEAALDPKDGIEAVLIDARANAKKAQAAKAATETEKIRAKELRGETEKLKEESGADRGSIGDLLGQSRKIKEDMNQHLELVSDSARTDAFSSRKQELEKEVKQWTRYMMVGVVVLLGAFGLIYFDTRGGFGDFDFAYRYLLTIPVIYFVNFTSRNYRNARDLLEKYAFKAVQSVTLSAQTKLLRDEFPERKDERLGFVLDTLGCIYKKPMKEKNYKRSINVGLKQLIQADVTEEETTDEEPEPIKEPVMKPLTDSEQKSGEKTP